MKTQPEAVTLTGEQGATDVHSGPVVVMSGGRPDHAVKCAHCDCCGPWAITAKLAIGLWNDGYESSRPAADRRRNESQPKKTESEKLTPKSGKPGGAINADPVNSAPHRNVIK
jgi:hypothetical protein